MARTRKVRPKKGGADLSPEEKDTLKAAGVKRRALLAQLAIAKQDVAAKQDALKSAKGVPNKRAAIEALSAANVNVNRLNGEIKKLGTTKPEENFVRESETTPEALAAHVADLGTAVAAADAREAARKPPATLEEADRKVKLLEGTVHDLQLAHPEDTDPFYTTPDWTDVNAELDRAGADLVLAQERNVAATTEAMRARGEAVGFPAPPPPAPPPPAPLLDETVPTRNQEISPAISSLPAAPVVVEAPLPVATVVAAPAPAAPLHAPPPLLRPAAEPNILKPDSKFVFVTTWTDRGEDHLSNCAGGASLGKTETLVNKWVENCKRLNCNYWAVEQDDKDLPDFILFALEKCGGKSVVFVDYDVKIKSYPVIFDRPNIDFMTTAYNIDPRLTGQNAGAKRKFGGSRPQNVCFDPYTLQPTGDVYYFANTIGSRELLQSWSQSIGLNLEKDEHDVLSMAFNAFKFGLPLAYIQLPSEYLALVANPNAILKHTDCLPANTDVPDYYSTLTEVECNRPPTKFYTVLEDDDGALKPYIDYAKSKDLYEVVPTSPGLSKALVVDKAIKQIREFINAEGYTFTEEAKYRKRFDGISAYDDIEVILPEKPTPPGLTYKLANVPTGEHAPIKLTGSVKDGVFNLAPAGRKFGGAPQKGVSFEFAIKNISIFGAPNADGSYGTHPRIENLDFIAVNTSDDDLHPALDLSKPYFMSKTMQSIIDLCSTKEELSRIFSSSHQVLAKIRCLWIHDD